MEDDIYKRKMIIKVTETEFETSDGEIHQMPFELDKVPTVEEFQEMYDEWYRLMQRKGLIDEE